MPRRRDPSIRLHPFGEELEKIIKTNNLTWDTVGKASGLGSSVLSKMAANLESRLNRENVLQCIVGLVKLDAITSVRRANDLLHLASLSNDRSEFRKLDRENLRDKLVIELMNNKAQERKEALTKQRDEQAKADLEKALEIQELYTSDGIPFIGRRNAVRTILTELMKDGTRFDRLFTITGIPGVGKTELALRIAELVRQYGYFSIVLVINLKQEDRQSDIVIRKISRQVEDIKKQDTRILLILDNCEQIEDTHEARNDIYQLLQKITKLTILATSRAQFSDYPHEYELLPFAPPDHKSEDVKILEKDESIQLFIEAAKRAKSPKPFSLTQENAPTVAALCTLVDGLPLALLIMGYWYIRLSEEMLRKMLFYLRSPVPLIPKSEKKLTIDQVIELSYRLLEPPEQMLLRRLEIFAGKCHLEAIAHVCSLDGDLPTAADDPNLAHWLDTLAKCHLIRFSDNMVRFAHNTIEMFAVRKLNKEFAGERPQLRKQFIIYYDRLVTEYMVSKYIKPKRRKKSRRFLGDEGANLIAVFSSYIIPLNIGYSKTKDKIYRKGYYWEYYDQSWIMEKIWGDERPVGLTQEEEIIEGLSETYQAVDRDGILYPSYTLWDCFVSYEMSQIDKEEYVIATDKHYKAVRRLIKGIYAVLNDQEKALFRRLGFFVDGCDLPKAMAVCNFGDLPGEETHFLQIAQSLSNHDLIDIRRDSQGNISIEIPIYHSKEWWYDMALYEFAIDKLKETAEVEKLHEKEAHYYIPLLAQYLTAKYENQASEEELKKYLDELKNSKDYYDLQRVYQFMVARTFAYIQNKVRQMMRQSLSKEQCQTILAIAEKNRDELTIEDWKIYGWYSELHRTIGNSDSGLPYPFPIIDELDFYPILIPETYSELET